MLVIGKPVMRTNCVSAADAAGPGVDHAAAGVDHRPLRRLQQRDRLGDLAGIGLGLRAVAADGSALGAAYGALPITMSFGRSITTGPGPAGARDVERLVHHPRQVLGALDQVIVLRRRAGDAGGVGLLEGVVADQVRRHLPGQADDRDAESISASTRPVTALVAPGPEVTSTTPTLPVQRA